MTPEEALDETCRRLGLKLPPAPKPVGAYQPAVTASGFAFLSGQISRDLEGKVVTGKLGKELTVEQGKRAAEWAALQALSLIRNEIGLNKIERLTRLVGYVQSSSDFYQQSEVMNAASELFVAVLGEKGRHARSAIGTTSLPLNAAVELELTLRLR